eukprot:gnl/TRDRNA2_/TRDRNA2_190309_c0_seq1.p1 gnl/TRDRNA2_/TRDRNA2_190309_c0~~gnl/TRDRNA2_/TRDRNA2_190309_c0_seq1.p1  ORF type:complete len:469 (+),score=83.92 gnl/TRDRNA2_/TRDRNA2_190309_c0_seq1:71-1477(+)
MQRSTPNARLPLVEPLLQDKRDLVRCVGNWKPVLASCVVLVTSLVALAIMHDGAGQDSAILEPLAALAGRSQFFPSAFKRLPTPPAPAKHSPSLPSAVARFAPIATAPQRIPLLATYSSTQSDEPASPEVEPASPEASVGPNATKDEQLKQVDQVVELHPEPPKAAVLPPLADPVSLQLLDANGFCARSGLQYAEEDGRWDLTVGAAVNGRSATPVSIRDVARSVLPKELQGLLPRSGSIGTSTFESPTVAFAYERGWRQNFARSGFPGPDEEVKLAEAVLAPFAAGKVLLDASCGSGLFTRRFVKSGKYGHVIALDFSDAMLRQARTFVSEQGVVDKDLTFVRADIARLPFPEGTIAGVHAGAAIHCWPDPQTALAEIARVLAPGASFCGTTFLTPQIPLVDDTVQQSVDAAVRDAVGARRTFRAWNKQDLADLFASCGLVNAQFDLRGDLRGGFVFFSATKPLSHS